MEEIDPFESLPLDMMKELMQSLGTLGIHLLSLTCKREFTRFALSLDQRREGTRLFINQCLEQGNFATLRTLFPKIQEPVESTLWKEGLARVQWERLPLLRRPRFALAYKHGHSEMVHWLIAKKYCMFCPPDPREWNIIGALSLIHGTTGETFLKRAECQVDAGLTESAAKGGQLKLILMLQKCYLKVIQEHVERLQKRLREVYKRAGILSAPRSPCFNPDYPAHWLLFANSVFMGAWEGKQWELILWLGKQFLSLGYILIRLLVVNHGEPLTVQHLEVLKNAFSIESIRRNGVEFRYWHRIKLFDPAVQIWFVQNVRLDIDTGLHIEELQPMRGYPNNDDGEDQPMTFPTIPQSITTEDLRWRFERPIINDLPDPNPFSFTAESIVILSDHPTPSISAESDKKKKKKQRAQLRQQQQWRNHQNKWRK